MKKLHTIEAICKEIQQVEGVSDVFPSAFPANSDHECIVVSFIGGTPTKDTVSYSTLQIICRAERPNRSYDLAVGIKEYFTSLRDVRLLSGEVVIQCNPQHPYPLYLGEDENRRHLYSYNYSLILSDE